VPDDFEMCLASPPTSTTVFEDATLFHFKGRLTLEPATVALPDMPATSEPAWIPFALVYDASGAEIVESEGEATIRFEVDTVPSSIYASEPAEGWESVIYEVPGRLRLLLAYPEGSDEFLVAPLEELDSELRLLVIGFAPPAEDGQPELRAEMAPCPGDDAIDRIEFTFAEGAVTFYTRPAFWDMGSGFTVRAAGEVDAIVFDVDSYWDLDYASGDFATAWYGFNPLFAVRFPEEEDGACILVVEPDPAALELTYTARILDCDHETLRELTVEGWTVQSV
jgi:hypothetical protein